MLLYLAGGNDGLNVVLPNGGADYALLRVACARPSGACRAPTAGGRMGSWQLPGPGSALAFANPVVSGARRQRRRDDTASTRSTATAPAAPGSDLAVMPAVDAKKYSLSHFDNCDLWFEASYDLNNKTGWLGRWIDRNGRPTTRCRRSRSTPRSRSRSAPRSKPVCAINSLPMNGFKPTAAAADGGDGSGRRRADPTRQ